MIQMPKAYASPSAEKDSGCFPSPKKLNLHSSPWRVFNMVKQALEVARYNLQQWLNKHAGKVFAEAFWSFTIFEKRRLLWPALVG